MEIIKNEKEFKVLKITKEESLKLGFGIIDDNNHLCICTGCNDDCKNDIYYICVLNDTMCKTCYNRWVNSKYTKRYEEDSKYESSNFNYYTKLLTENK